MVSSAVCCGAILLSTINVAAEPPQTKQKKPPQPAPARAIEWRSLEDAWNAARKQDRPLMVYITLKGCAYCRKMQETTHRDRQVARRVMQGFVASKVTAAEHPNLVRRLGVEIYPTTVIISPKSGLLAQINGYASADDLLRRLSSANGGGER